MKKYYFIAPLVGLLLFIAYYWNFQRTYAAEKQAKIVAERIATEKRIAEENEKKMQAYQEAIKQQEENKRIREEKKAREEAAKQARAEAVKARDKAYQDKNKLEQRRDRIKQTLEIETETIARVKESKIGLVGDKAATEQYIVQAGQNRQKMEDLLNQIEAKEKAAIEAAAAAAKQKK